MNPYWFEPVFHGKGLDCPRTRETALLFIKRKGQKSEVLLPLPGSSHRAWLETREQVVGVAWEMDRGCTTSGIPIAFRAASDEPLTLVPDGTKALQPLLRTFQHRTNKPIAPFVDWFGWCTWDAFYHDVTEEKTLAGLKVLKKGGMLPGFLILDDGWQDSHEWHLNSIEANRKFAGNLEPLTKSARKLGVKHVGVWHTLHGYWHGVSSSGKIAKEFRVVDIPQTTKAFAGWPAAFDPPVRNVIHQNDIHRFYDVYYEKLAEAGIDFTKVDGQASFQYCLPAKEEGNSTISAYQRALQGAVTNHMAAGSIHCMANVSDLLWRMHSAKVWRNSDDFYPKKPFRDQAKHLVSNAYNALLTGSFAIPDWDMFHSRHPFALFHAVARALSGGPVYISDTPGNHDFDLLRRLVLPDGRVPRFQTPGTPPASWLYSDPLSSGRALTISNCDGPVAAIGMFNCLCEPEPARITDDWSPSDVFASGADTYIAYQILTGTAQMVSQKGKISATLEPEGACAVWTVSPIRGGLFAPLGLENYFGAAATLDSVEDRGANTYVTLVRHGGTHVAWCACEPESVEVNGAAARTHYNRTTQLLKVYMETQAPGSITYRFPVK